MKFFLKFRVILAGLILLIVLTVSTVLVFQGEEADAEDAGLSEDGRRLVAEQSISAAELQDLQAVAEQYGISLQEAIDWYAWRNNFSQAVSRKSAKRLRHPSQARRLWATTARGSRLWAAPPNRR